MNDDWKRGLRQRLVDHERRAVRLANLVGSAEAEDSYTRTNCGGLGRLRHFADQSIILNSDRGVVPKRKLYRTLPAGLPYTTQCYQLAGCNWQCWYCFVDDSLLRADESVSIMVPISDLIDLYLQVEVRSPVLDLSGGQPELVPEWALWTMEELEARGLRGTVHVRVDDNLSGTSWTASAHLMK